MHVSNLNITMNETIMCHVMSRSEAQLKAIILQTILAAQGGRNLSKAAKNGKVTFGQKNASMVVSNLTNDHIWHLAITLCHLRIVLPAHESTTTLRTTFLTVASTPHGGG